MMPLYQSEIMTFKFYSLKPKHKIYVMNRKLIYMLFALVICMFGCKKFDYTDKFGIEKDKVSDRFFQLNNSPTLVLKAALSLKKEKGFINDIVEFVNINGYPKWEKTVFSTNTPSQYLTLPTL